jgi:hypothetical protein
MDPQAARNIVGTLKVLPESTVNDRAIQEGVGAVAGFSYDLRLGSLGEFWAPFCVDSSGQLRLVGQMGHTASRCSFGLVVGWA